MDEQSPSATPRGSFFGPLGLLLLFRRWRRWQRQQPNDHWLADSEVPEVSVQVSSAGGAAFDSYSEFRGRYGIDESQAWETAVHLRAQSDGSVAVVMGPHVPGLPPTDIGVITAEDAAPYLPLIRGLPVDKVARAELVARATRKSTYEAKVRGYPPDIMRMWSAGYLDNVE